MANRPYIPDAPDVVSPTGDIFPNFEWEAVADPDLAAGSSEGIIYDLQLFRYDPDGTPVLIDTVFGISGASAVSALVDYEWGFEGLTQGSYAVRVRSYDGVLTSEDWSESTNFNIIYQTINKNKIFIVAPDFEDPTLGRVRFFDPVMEDLYERVKQSITLAEFVQLYL